MTQPSQIAYVEEPDVLLPASAQAFSHAYRYFKKGATFRRLSVLRHDRVISLSESLHGALIQAHLRPGRTANDLATFIVLSIGENFGEFEVISQEIRLSMERVVIDISSGSPKVVNRF